ncbi:hypothetical protein AYO40_06595 [Planctomycetaceae bacterium SCGC AG-212-D15]|nr:hypothetical protein AYO40_06595 [Planctomycetaceae bacterium SCGC AG-212-D15]
MSALLNSVDAWLIAVVLAAAIFATWGVGLWMGGRERSHDPEAPASRLNDASLALLGLLLGFTFSMSLAKHEQRRTMVVTDSNAIGDFYTCVSLLKQPVRGRLQRAVRNYTEHRIGLADPALDDAGLQIKLGEIQEMHDQMQALVKEAVDEGTSVTNPLVNTFNNLTSSHAERLAAVRDNLPGSVILLLFVAAIVSMGLVGEQQGASGERRPGATIAFVAVISMVVWVTLDMNQPRRGMIIVSQEPMHRLLSGMEK